MGFYVHVHPKGWIDGEGMKLWLEKVWSKHPGVPNSGHTRDLKV